MTDRVHSFQVVLERDIRIDDVEPLLGAVRQLRGVVSVVPIISTFEAHMAEERAKLELEKHILNMLQALREGRT